MELKCNIQTYDWGKIGLQSKVATLFQAGNPDFVVDNTKPYAELWMGTHPNGPSHIKNNNELLSTVIKEHPNYLGPKVQKHFGNELPFLFKVLSINKALSIQAHPAKEHAEQLHAQRPDLYKDPNHKPELAIALTPFEALCGFRPAEEIKKFLQSVPELKVVIGEDATTMFLNSNQQTGKEALKLCFRKLMTCNQEQVSIQLKHILQRLSGANENQRISQLAPLVERLYSQFPDDIGCFSVYFLNVLHLKPYEALYMGPNEPHAYLSGDCIECMACSDNVVRAGLTPKFKDVETLCNMLTYDMQTAQRKLFKPILESDCAQIFKPPVPDFAVAKIEISAGVKCQCLKARESASILLIVNGSGMIKTVSVKSGTVLFVPANEQVHVSDITENLLMFQAMANV